MDSSATDIISQVHMVSLGERRPDDVVCDKLQHRQGREGESESSQPISDDGDHASHTKHDETTPCVMPKRAAEKSDKGNHSVQSDQEGSISSIVSVKASRNTDGATYAFQSGSEGSTTVTREKVSEDGYNWRKYGQKLVKGNEFVRSYYRCTHPNCQVKKQLERTHDGQITDTIYLGQHDHPRPQLNLPLAVGLVVSIMEEKPEKASLSSAKDKSSSRHGQTPKDIEPTETRQLAIVEVSNDVKDVLSPSSRLRDEVDNDYHQGLKRLKKDSCNADATPSDKPLSESRVVVQTLSEVDIVNDGYRWRKYGQKLVKGNANPRSYYRCSTPGCPVKKHVERASHDPKLVLTTYEGKHDHDMPPVRTVTHNTGQQHITPTAQNDESGTILTENACVDIVAYSSSDPDCKLNEQLCGSGGTKLEANGKLSFEAEQQNGKSSTREDGESNEPQNGRSSASEESRANQPADSISESKSDEQLSGELGTKMKESGVVSCGMVFQVTSGSESKMNEQQQSQDVQAKVG